MKEQGRAPIRIGYKSEKLVTHQEEGIGKVPPQAIELEEAVLGALMLEKDALTAVIDLLKPASFYKNAHGLIYEAIRTLFNESQPIDLLTVTNQLRKDGTLEEVGVVVGSVQIQPVVARGGQPLAFTKMKQCRFVYGRIFVEQGRVGPRLSVVRATVNKRCSGKASV